MTHGYSTCMCECVSSAISPSLLPSLCLSFKVLGDIEMAQNMQSEKHQVAKDVSITVVEQWFNVLCSMQHTSRMWGCSTGELMLQIQLSVLRL